MIDGVHDVEADGHDHRRRRVGLGSVVVAALACVLAAGPAQVVDAQDAETTSPTTSPTASTTASPRADVPAGLAEELAATLARFPDLTGTGRVGIAVLDATGAPVWGHDDDVELLPASTMKSLTATSVLDVFGLDGTITTSATSTATIDDDGVLDGSLVLQGRGDPTLTSDDYRRWVHPSRPSTAIEDLADQLVEAGLRRVTRWVGGDGTAFGPASAAASGWPERYFGDYDAHNLSGLTIDTGRRVEVSEGPSPSLTITQAPDPALVAAEVFAQALADRGVVIEGRVRSAIRPVPDASETVASVTSPPMRDVLRFMLQESDNQLADQLVRAAALESADDGSWTAAGDGVREALAAADVSTSGFVLSDGSGLSRTNRVSAELLARNDHAQFDRWGRRWSRMLAVAGEAGTLEGRLVGGPAQGRLFAKTGTLDDVRGLAGHVVASGGAASGGQRFHVAMLVNDVSSDIRWQASVLGDELALVLVDALDGCRRTRRVEVPAPRPTPSADAPRDRATASATPSPSTSTSAPATVRRRVTATPDDPGPALASDEWTRDCD